MRVLLDVVTVTVVAVAVVNVVVLVSVRLVLVLVRVVCVWVIVGLTGTVVWSQTQRHLKFRVQACCNRELQR